MFSISTEITDFIPLASALFVLVLGIYIFNENKRSKTNILFLLFSLSVTGWLFGTFMLFISENEKQILFWDRFIYSSVILIPGFLFHFIAVFAEKDKEKKREIVLTYFLFSLFIFINIFTKFFVDEVFYYKWGAHAKAGIFHDIFLVLFTLYSVEVYRMIIGFYLRNKGLQRKQALFIFIAFLNFGTIGFSGFLPAYEISVYPFAYVSGVIFAVLIAYVVAKYQFLAVKTFATQVFIFFIVIISFTEIFFSDSITEYILRSSFFVVILFFSFLIVSGIKLEIQRKEELQEMSDELAKANDQLKKLDRAKSEFISIASHQLRTPLTATKGFISLMLEGSYGKINPKSKDVLHKVYVANEHLVQLVEDLLNVSRIESGRMEYNFKKSKLEDILDELKNNFILAAKGKKLYLHFKVSAKLPEIEMDSNKIREVISNLIDNALKYSKKGGVTVKVEKQGVGDDQIIRIIVSDTGIGIPKTELPYIFSKFSRGKDTSRLDVGGTGLGLFVGKNMIAAHNGRLWAESDGEGKGSRFIIELPVKHVDKPPQ